MQLSKILLPVDFSERSAGAAHYAKALACRFRSELIMAHAFELKEVVVNVPEAGVPPNWYEDRRRQTEQTLADFLADEFRETQEGTLHFHYLTDRAFGHLYVARSLDEHVVQIETSLRGDDDPGRNRRFVERFVRPLGLDVSATSAVVDAAEELGRRPAVPSNVRFISDAQVRYLSSLAWRRRRATRRRAKAARSAVAPIGPPESTVPPR